MRLPRGDRMEANVKKIILEKLCEIEKREGVEILHAVESGSRAWGFPSPDSDYDVRFIYLRPREHYLRLDKVRDVIEWQLDETLDINGWDLQKALRLVHKSNPTVFEWRSSPIVYKTTGKWQEISEVTGEYFNKREALYHYLNIARGNYRAYLTGERVRLKKYFYVLRPLLACKWILAEGTPPPMPFGTLMEKYLDEGVRGDVQRLLEMKTKTPELGEAKHLYGLDEYLVSLADELDGIISALPKDSPGGWDRLNDIFLKQL